MKSAGMFGSVVSAIRVAVVKYFCDLIWFSHFVGVRFIIFHCGCWLLVRSEIFLIQSSWLFFSILFIVSIKKFLVLMKIFVSWRYLHFNPNCQFKCSKFLYKTLSLGDYWIQFRTSPLWALNLRITVWWNCSANKCNSGLLLKMDWITGIFLCRQNGNHP
jgi:hypothetical protein